VLFDALKLPIVKTNFKLQLLKFRQSRHWLRSVISLSNCCLEPFADSWRRSFYTRNLQRKSAFLCFGRNVEFV